MNKLFWILPLVGLTVWATAQTPGIRENVEIRQVSGEAYPYPLLGGLNNPQFSEIDLNGDNIMDLFVFDKAGDIILTFLNEGTLGQVDYRFAPEYISHFPEGIKEWALLRDYNNDGVMDLFCYSFVPGIAGISAYRGSFDPSNGLSFEFIQNFQNDYDLLSFPSFSGLELEIYVSSEDIPSLVDVDMDGDMDVLTFSVVGDKFEYYKNMSDEFGYGADSLIFEFADPCWGLFLESGVSSSIQLSNNENQCADLNKMAAGAHVGSTSVCWDNDGDGDMELIVGDVTTNTLSYLRSTATGVDENPWMNELDASFPSYDVPVNIPLFPAAYVLDVNNDGRQDLICSSNAVGNSVNVNTASYYKNTSPSGEGLFEFQQTDFLSDGCVDLGQGSKPVFFDYDSDGLYDLVVGTDGYFLNIGQYDSRLILYRNVGSITNPIFQMEDEDWLGFSQYTDRNLAPAFGDLDGDGDLDLLVGEKSGDLFYAENTGNGGPSNFPIITPQYKDIDGGQECVPAIMDMDGDGLADIITGIKQGRLTFFKNIGSGDTPDFHPVRGEAPNIDGIGAVDIRVFNSGFADPRGYAAPKTFRTADGKDHLIVGSYFNNLHIYTDLADSLQGTFTHLSTDYGNIYEGQETAADLADIDHDGYFEMVVGNLRGGFSIYQTEFTDLTISTDDLAEASISIRLSPNPTNGMLTVDYSEGVDIPFEIVDINGRQLVQGRTGNQLDVSPLPSGVYFVVVNMAGRTKTKRFAKY